MKARNNISSYFDFADDDVDHHSDDGFTTPVKRGKKDTKTPVAPIKTSNNVSNDQPSFSPVKFSFENLEAPDSPVKTTTSFDNFTASYKTPTKSVSVGNLPDAPKKPLTQNNFSSTSLPDAPNFTDVPKRRRNLDALGDNIGETKDDYKRRVNTSDTNSVSSYPKGRLPASSEASSSSSPLRGRDISDLEAKILNSTNGDAAVSSENPFQKSAKKQGWGKKQEKPYYPTYEVKEPEVKKPEPVNMNDSELFPTLGAVSTEAKKVSVWNVFNPTLMMANQNKPVSVVPKTISKTTIQKPVLNSSNTQYSETEDTDQEYDEDEEYYEDDNYEEMEEDSEVVYWREMYQKRDQLIDDIRFVKRNMDRYNGQHVRFLRQLQQEIADVEDEIYRNECLDNELEKIYGPSYFNQKSLYDEMKEKRDREARENKSKQSTEDFLKSINSCLLQSV
jgi:hypothetical protein